MPAPARAHRHPAVPPATQPLCLPCRRPKGATRLSVPRNACATLSIEIKAITLVELERGLHVDELVTVLVLPVFKRLLAALHDRGYDFADRWRVDRTGRFDLALPAISQIEIADLRTRWPVTIGINGSTTSALRGLPH